jgi:hypothetical protein
VILVLNAKEEEFMQFVTLWACVIGAHDSVISVPLPAQLVVAEDGK